MSTQKGLRDRLRSVNNMLHITQAMDVVASVHFRKVMHKMEHLRFYSHKLAELVHKLKLSNAAEQHPLFKQRESRRIGLMIVGGDKGLCGSYNGNVIKEAEKFLQSKQKDQVELIIFGDKIVNYFKKSPWTIKRIISDFSHKLTEPNIREWSREFIDSFEGKEYDELWVVFTRFRNVVSKQTVVEKILPLEIKAPSEKETSIAFTFESNPVEIYESIVPLGFAVKVHSILVEAYASELASRMIAMKAASKNAEEMIDKLTLIKNKNRQLSITNEILEITAGAEGLK